MPPLVLPTLLFGGPGRPGGFAICSTPLRKLISPGGQGGTWGDWSPREGRLAPKGPDLPQKVLGPTGFPKGKPLWPLFRAFLAGQKGTAGDRRRDRSITGKKPSASRKCPSPAWVICSESGALTNDSRAAAHGLKNRG